MAEALTAEQRDLLRRKLLEMRITLAALDASSEGWRATVDLDQQSVGRLSRMDALQQQAMSEAEARRRKSDLARIGHALRLIEEDEYGWCAECGEGIAFKRLEIDPMATRCVGCAQ